ncbi:MAG: hypothetical protein WA210_12715, partial [Burkholderiaceae bacterium]
TVRVQFLPTTAASFSRTLTVAYTGATVTPASVSLTGTGVAPTVTFTSESGAGTLTGTTLNFGNNTTGPYSVTLTISAPVTFGTVVVANTGGSSGGNPTPYTLGANTCTGSIGPGTCTITVNFNNGNGNTKTGTLTVPYTGGTGSPAVLNLTGS